MSTRTATSRPPHVHDPMTMVLRENAIQAHLMHWDDARGRFALTGAGRRRISARGRAPGRPILQKKRRDAQRCAASETG
jgi:hypothetical protein